MNILITTTNRGKLDAAERALEEFGSSHPGLGLNVRSVSAESGVSDTPLSDEEGILGCENRIKQAELELPGQDLYIALEGVIAQVADRWFVRGWTMVKDTNRNRVVVASGSAVQVPDNIAEHISSAEQFSQQVKQIYAVTPEEAEQVRNIGANGVFSGGEYTRRDTFYDGVRICLAHLSNDRNWTTN